jgi:hypothetical protein
MIEVLFIAFQYPPINVAGSIRPYMFSKYLPKFNIKPIILTLDTIEQDDYKVDQDNRLIQSLPSSVKIYSTPINKKNTSTLQKFKQIYLSIGDDKHKRWKKGALVQIENIIQKNNIKAVFFTAPPFSNGNLAVEVSAKYHLPLILDMRDGWSKWCIAPYASILHYKLTKLKEAYFFKHASTIITVTNVLKDIFLESHPNLNSDKIEVIPNGFDIIDNEIPSFLSATSSKEQEIKIGYIGSFYYNPSAEKSLNSAWWQKKPHRWFQYFPVNEKWIYRSPFFFLKTLSGLLKERPEYKSRIKFVFIGNEEPWLAEMVNNFDLGSNYENRGFVEHCKLEDATKDLNFFLATSVKVEGGEDYAIASKTFDYIKFEKPIIGFVTNGTQKVFIKKSNTGIIFDPDDTTTNVKKLNTLIEKGCSLDVNTEYLKKFTRLNSAKDLARIIIKQI